MSSEAKEGEKVEGESVSELARVESQRGRRHTRRRLNFQVTVMVAEDGTTAFYIPYYFGPNFLNKSCIKTIVGNLSALCAYYNFVLFNLL